LIKGLSGNLYLLQKETVEEINKNANKVVAGYTCILPAILNLGPSIPRRMQWE